MMFPLEIDEFHSATPESLFHLSFMKRVSGNGPHVDDVNERENYSSVSPLNIIMGKIHQMCGIVIDNTIVINISD
jgi:hypothetical protein